MPHRRALHHHIESALADFRQWLSNSTWFGKERDCVNLFAHRFLADRIGPDSPIKHLTQIGIEVAVPQRGVGIKPSVCRDLVIWDEPNQVTWTEKWVAGRAPWAILEWKARRRTYRPGTLLDDKDRIWLGQFVRHHSTCLVYVVAVDFTSTSTHLDWELLSHLD